MNVDYYARIASTAYEVRDRILVVMPCNPGHLDVIPPGHLCRISSRKQSDLVVIALDAEFFARKAVEALGETHHVVLRHDAVDPFMHAVGSELRGEFVVARLPSATYLEALSGVVAIHLAASDGTRIAAVSEAGLAPGKLNHTLMIIEEHLADEVHLNQLAAAVHLSPFHFARMFKRAMGQAPHAYITLQRIEHAKSLLRDGVLPLVEVAARVGYQTQAHFTDVFHKYTGITPRAYRVGCDASRRQA